MIIEIQKPKRVHSPIKIKEMQKTARKSVLPLLGLGISIFQNFLEFLFLGSQSSYLYIKRPEHSIVS